MYPASSKPEDVLAAFNYNAIRNWLYLDMAVFGRYNTTAWAYMKEKAAHRSSLKGYGHSAVGQAGFIAFNYYTSQTAEASRGDGSDTAARGGDQHLQTGEEGVYRGSSNPHLKKTHLAGRSTLSVSVRRCAKFTTATSCR
ncbi:family 1 glycosylhydrolase [Bacillus licheniformis]|nr:family 1 glycosylhydrolase [Bacillus licheniformis]